MLPAWCFGQVHCSNDEAHFTITTDWRQFNGGNGPSPNDSNGHGSHTSSTSGGNVVPVSAVPPPSQQIQGIAPCANMRMYKVCPTSSCPGANITGLYELRLVQ